MKSLALLKSHHINPLIWRDEQALPCLWFMCSVNAFHSGVSADYQKNPIPGCVGGGASTKLILTFPLENESFKNWACCVSVYTTTENEKSAGMYHRHRRSSSVYHFHAFAVSPVLSNKDVLQQTKKTSVQLDSALQVWLCCPAAVILHLWDPSFVSFSFFLSFKIEGEEIYKSVCYSHRSFPLRFFTVSFW